MNSSPDLASSTVLRGTSAAQVVAFTPGSLTDLSAVSDDDTTADAPSTGRFSVPTLADLPDLADLPAVFDATSVETHAATSDDALADADGSAAGVAAPGASPSVQPGTPVNGEGVSGGPLRFEQVYADQMAVLREQAHREGFEAGHAEGMAAAEQAIAEMVEAAHAQVEAEQQAWRVQAQSAMAALSAAVTALDTRTAPPLAEMTDSLADAAYTLVEDLLGHELAAATHPARDAVERALRLVPADEPVVVRLHPNDHAALDAEWLTLLRAGASVVADPTVEPSGAVAESGARRVDAQLSTALARVREVLHP